MELTILGIYSKFLDYVDGVALITLFVNHIIIQGKMQTDDLWTVFYAEPSTSKSAFIEE